MYNYNLVWTLISDSYVHISTLYFSSSVENGETFNIAYGTGSCAGTLVQDTVCVTGPNCVINSPLSVSNVTFGQADQMAAFFAQTELDGVSISSWDVSTR